MRRRNFLGGLFTFPALGVVWLKSRCAKADVKKGSIEHVKVRSGCKNTNCFVRWDHDNKRVLISHDDIRTERVKNDKFKVKGNTLSGDQLLLITRDELGCIMTSFGGSVANYSSFERNADHAEIYYQRAMAQPPDYDIVSV